MRVAAAIALMAGSAAAFAPANTGRVSTAVAGAFDSEIGATDFGDRTVCWDPLNFVNNGDQARFDRLRSVEIKHGRVAMMATLGYASTYGNEYRFPGCENFPGGHAAVIGDSAINTIDLILPILAQGEVPGPCQPCHGLVVVALQRAFMQAHPLLEVSEHGQRVLSVVNDDRAIILVEMRDR